MTSSEHKTNKHDKIGTNVGAGNVEPFIVENIGNTCYIDSLLMALFYFPSTNDFLLDKDVEESLYLQQYIKTNFVDKVRQGKSVNEENIYTIRNLCIDLGWLNGDPIEFFSQQDVNEFYMFLMDKLKGTLIKTKRETKVKDVSNETDIQGREEIIPFISLPLPQNETTVDIKDLINNWIYDNNIKVKRSVIKDGKKMEKNFDASSIVRIINNPPFLGLSIHRYVIKDGKRGDRINPEVKTPIIISPFQNIMLLNPPEWKFHAIICYREGITKEGEYFDDGHYYTLLADNKGNDRSKDKYYIFDDKVTPCVRMVDLANDPLLAKQLRRESVFFIYRYHS